MRTLLLGSARVYEVRALAFGEIVKGAWKLYSNPLGTYMATVLIMLPRLLLQPLIFYLVTGRFGPLGSAASPAQVLEDLWVIGLWFLPSMLLSLLQTGALITAAASIYQGKPISFHAAIAAAWRRLPSLLGVEFLVALFIMLGMVALIIPGFFLALRYQFTSQVVLIEGLGADAALSRSRALTRGRYIQLLGLSLVLTLPLFVFHCAVAAALPVSLAGIPMLGAVLRQLPLALLMPLYHAALTLAYFDASACVAANSDRIESAADGRCRLR